MIRYSFGFETNMSKYNAFVVKPMSVERIFVSLLHLFTLKTTQLNY